MYVLYACVVVDWWSVMQLGRKRARGNSIGWSVLRFTFVLIIQIRTRRYVESNISLKKMTGRIYMHIGTVCKGTVSLELFTQVLFLGFYLFGINRIACKEYFQRKLICVIVQQYFDIVILSMLLLFWTTLCSTVLSGCQVYLTANENIACQAHWKTVVVFCL